MDSKSFSQRLPSTSGTQSIYEAIKLHDQHPAGEDDDRQDDARIDEENLDVRFQDQDLDALLAEAEGSALDSEAPTSRDKTLSPVQEHQKLRAAEVAEPSKSKEDHASLSPGAEDGDDVPASLLMEGRESESPLITHGHRLTWDSPQAVSINDERRGGNASTKDEQRSGNDEVPPSLLFGTSEPPSPDVLGKLPPKPSEILPTPVPGPSRRSRRVQWDTRQTAIPQSKSPYSMPRSYVGLASAGPIVADPTDRAMWMWANVENLDSFLAEVYDYFKGKGIWSILLSRLFEQLTLAFVVGFGTFLTSCINYRKIPGAKTLPEVVITRCTSKMSGLSNLLLWLLSFFWLLKSLRIAMNMRRYWTMHEFFTHLLHVTEDELQTITWQAIVSRLMNLRDANARTALDVAPRNRKFLGEHSKQRMDAHDIANRLMRRDNYLIALFNKDVLNLTLPIPFLRNRQFFSRNLEWNINLCVLEYVFNEAGQVSQLFLRDSHRSELIEGLRRRFQIMGFINIISAPFLVTYFLMLYFLRYFNEFQKNPSQIGSRSYTPLAEWKFREFNELYNFFERRLNMSRPFASRYLDQFPKDKVSQTARFVAFVAGSLASVLGLASLLDPDVFLGFEITKDRTVLFYLGLFGTIWAVARGMVAEDEDNVFDPEYAINNVAEFTHYKPAHWQGRLHTEDVRRDFAQLYQMKVVIFLEEILSIVFTPFVLWFSLPDCSARIVDFFREFTVHVDGLGYICSFALFEFQKEGVGMGNIAENVATRPSLSNGVSTGQSDGRRAAATGDLRKDYFAAKDNKMLSSYYNFIDSYANNPTGKAFNRQHDKRIFRPPPTFPSVVYEEARDTTPHQHPSVQYHQRPSSTSDSSHRLQRRTRHPLDESALAPSLLLDPQHLPLQGRPRPSVGPSRDDPATPRGNVRHYLNMHKDPLSTTGVTTESSVAMDEDSNLGDSWKTTKAAEEDLEAGKAIIDVTWGANKRPGNAEGIGRGRNDAGVLGLLYEFQKAQTEGGGGGVKI